MPIRSFGDKATEEIFYGRESKETKKRYSTSLRRRVKQKLDVLDAARALRDLYSPPSNRLEPLKGDRKGYWSIRVNDQWRIVFRWDSGNAYDALLADYH
jgi:toxin HigB-1